MRHMLNSSTRLLRRMMGWWLLVVTIAVGFGVIGMAHSQTRDAQQLAQSGQATPSQSPVFRSGITLVTTDVIVRDENGAFISDLTTDDFEVYEDGNEQEIASLVLVHGGRIYNQLLPPPVVQEGIILPLTQPTNGAAGRIFVFFIDDLHLQTSLTPMVRRVFKEMTDILVHEGDMFGIVSSGSSAIAIDMTYDREMLEVARGKIMGSGFAPFEMIQNLVGGVRGVEELRFNAHVAFKTVLDVIENLEEVEHRRKAIIYVSSGYDFNPFANERVFGRRNRITDDDEEMDALYRGVAEPEMNPFLRELQGGVVFADSDLSLELSELTKAANRANASFYTVDPRGLVAGPSIGDLGRNTDSGPPLEAWREYVTKSQNTLRVLAELTGGIAVVNRNGFDDAFKEIDAETSDYYVLGFYSSNSDPTYRTRRLVVEVDREDVSVRARTHYTFKGADGQ